MNGGNKLGTQPVACSVSDTSKQSDTRDGRLSTSPADLQESPKACPGKEHVGEGSTGAAENSKVTASGSHGHRARPSTPASKSDECVPFRRSTRQAGIRRPSPSKNMSAPPQVKKKSTGAPLNQQPWPSDRRGVRCKFKGCSEPPSYSFDGRRPAVRCGNHRDVGAKMYRVEHIGAKICGKKGCGRPATTSYMSQDGRIVRRCSEHTQSDVAALTTATRCQYEECMAEPRYGAKKGPLSFCNDHKRVGMFTVRHGQLMIATRDGSAHLRREALSEQIEAATATYATAASTAAAAAVTTTSASASASATAATAAATTGGTFTTAQGTILMSDTSNPPVGKSSNADGDGEIADKGRVAADATGRGHGGDGGGKIGAAWDRRSFIRDNGPAEVEPNHRHISRKLCEIPGCEIQPSYGQKGTRKAIFCSNHKGPGMVAVKNRPCAFPGCDTRPHYGVSRGRPEYCARHMTRGMVHILKEQSNLQKEAAARKRLEAKKKNFPTAQKNANGVLREKPEKPAAEVKKTARSSSLLPPPPSPIEPAAKSNEGNQRRGSKASDHKPTDTVPKGRSDHKPTNAVPKGKSDHKPTDAAPKGKSDHKSTDAVPKGKSDHKASNAVPKGKSDHKASNAVPKGKSDHKSTNAVPKGKSDHKSTDAVPKGKSDHKSTNAVPKGRSDHKSTNATPKSRSDHKSTDAVPKGKADHKSTNAVPKGKADHKPTDAVPKGKADHKSTDAVPKGRSDHKSTDAVPKGRSDHKSTDAVPKGRSDHKSTDAVPKGRSDHKPTDAVPKGKTGKQRVKLETLGTPGSPAPSSSRSTSAAPKPGRPGKSTSTPPPSRQRASSPTAAEPTAAPSSTSIDNASRPSPAVAIPAGSSPTEELTLKAVAESVREAARAAAAASGSGRRPRAPSLKAIEASGLGTGEGAQLMNKEMKAEQARRAREYKEKRRAFEAERLRIKRALLEAKKNGEAVGNIARGAAQGNGKGKSNESARKSSLADVMPLPHSAAPQLGGKLRNGLAVDGMEQAGKREKHTSKQAHRSAKDDAKQEKNSVGAGSTNMDVPARSDGTGTEEGSAVEVTDNRPGDVSAVTTGTSGTRTKQSTGQPAATKRARAAAGTAGSGGRSDGEGDTRYKKQKTSPHSSSGSSGTKRRRSSTSGEATAPVLCLTESCSKIATHGINNKAQYCKEHCLFGMYEIIESG